MSQKTTPMPQAGGSYIRAADGSLVRESFTEDATAPVGLAEAEPDATVEKAATPPAKPRKPRAKPAAQPTPAPPEPEPDAATPNIDTPGETA